MAGKSKKGRPAWREAIPLISPCKVAGRFFGRMEDVLEQSDKTGLEHGFTLCVNKKTGKIAATESCQGDKCSLTPVKCEPGEELYGDFHVHPSADTEPSMPDLGYMMYHDQRVGCIAASREVRVVDGIIVPETRIGCHGFDVDNPNYSEFKNKTYPLLREASNISHNLTTKQYIEKKAITTKEWSKYKEKKGAVLKKLEDSGLYWKQWHCPPLEEKFGVISRYRLEQAKHG